jgi:hypothetical protein
MSSFFFRAEQKKEKKKKKKEEKNKCKTTNLRREPQKSCGIVPTMSLPKKYRTYCIWNMAGLSSGHEPEGAQATILID